MMRVGECLHHNPTRAFGVGRGRPFAKGFLGHWVFSEPSGHV